MKSKVKHRPMSSYDDRSIFFFKQKQTKCEILSFFI